MTSKSPDCKAVTLSLCLCVVEVWQSVDLQLKYEKYCIELRMGILNQFSVN